MRLTTTISNLASHNSLFQMETEFPWTWRLTRPNREKPTWKDVLKYRKWIQLMLKVLQKWVTFLTTRISVWLTKTGIFAFLSCSFNSDLCRMCADCGLNHHPQGPLNREAPPRFTVAFANPMLGVFLCPEYIFSHSSVIDISCANCHKEVLPPSLSRSCSPLQVSSNLSTLHFLWFAWMVIGRHRSTGSMGKSSFAKVISLWIAQLTQILALKI